MHFSAHLPARPVRWPCIFMCFGRRIVPETDEALSIRFEVPPDSRSVCIQAGQHLTLELTIDGEEVRRNYSLCTAPDEGDWM